jgi:hypothetical protein
MQGKMFGQWPSPQRQSLASRINRPFSTLTVAVGHCLTASEESTMSWEESVTATHPCPCGKGTWVEITKSDDWNRSEEHAEMRCAKCDKTHRIDGKEMPDNGLSYTRFSVVPR